MIGRIKNNYYYIKIKSIISILIPLVYTAYNGTLGIFKHLIWNGSIAIYYLLLFLIRSLLLKFNGINNALHERRIYIISFVLLVFINGALIVPAILMIKNMHIVTIGMISAIAMAAYTTYAITISIYRMASYKGQFNLIYRQLMIVNFVNAITSLLVLQNTLIVVNGGYDSGLVKLSMVSTIGFIVINIVVILYAFIKNMRAKL